MKKIIALAVATMLVMTGCGGKKANEDETGKVLINWMPQNDQPVDTNSPIIKALEEKFDCEFEFTYVDRNKENELLSIRVAGGEIPDVMRRTDVQLHSFIDQGVLRDIPEDMIKEVAPKLYEMTKVNSGYGDDVWNFPKVDDKIYGIPLLNYNGQYHAVSIWRDDWLKNVGIDKIPETIHEAEEAFYKFRNNDPDGNGQKDTYALSTNGIKAVLNAYGAHPYNMFWSKNADGKIQLSATLPEMKEGLTKLNQYYKDGLIDPEFVTGENKGQTWSNAVTFWNGKIGYSMPGMIYHVTKGATNTSGSANWRGFKGVQPDGTYDYGVPLKGKDGKYGAEHWGVFAAQYLAIGKDVSDKKLRKILEICEAINSDFETYSLVMHGRKGQEYKEENGKITNLIDAKQKAIMGINTNGLGYVQNNLEFSEKFIDKETLDLYKKNASYTDDYTNLVWGALPSDSTYRSIISAKIDEAYVKFITGDRPISEFDKFVKELNDAGLEQLTKEANEWYNKYNK